MSGPTLIAKIVPRATKKIFGKDKSKARISMPRLLDQWGSIIAPEDPSEVMPLRITWKKTGDDVNKSSAGTLHVMAPSALAAKLMYQEKIIVERVNRLFGLPSNTPITRLNVTHGALAGGKVWVSKKTPASMDAQTRAALAQVDDPVLRQKLESLAQSMADKNR